MNEDTELSDLLQSALPLTVADRVRMAGGRLEAAGLAALAAAATGLTSQQSHLSLPVPARGPNGPAYRFLLSLYYIDEEAGDDALFEPELAVTIDGETLEPLEHERWREPIDASRESPLTFSQPPAVRLLSAHHLAALRHEISLLHERLAGWFLDGGPPDRQAAARYQQLFCFLAPAALFPYYRRLNPDFIDWLSDQTGLRDLVQVDEPPEPRVEPPLETLPAATDPLTAFRGLRAGVDWRLHAGTLADALRYLELLPTRRSPLRQLDLSAAVEGFALAEVIPGWPTDEWRAALQTLCDPLWRIELDRGDAGGSLTDRFWVGRGKPVVWVLHDVVEDQHLVSFPRAPDEIGASLLAWLGAAEVEAADPVQVTLRLSELQVVLALADRWLASGDDGFAATKDDLEAALTPVDDEPGLRWTRLGGGMAPVPLLDVTVEAGVEGLLERGWLERGDRGVVATSALRGLILALGQPLAYGRLHTLHHKEEDCSSGAGFLAVRTVDRLWLGEVAQAWDCETPPADPRFRLLQVSGEQLADLTGVLLGIER